MKSLEHFAKVIDIIDEKKVKVELLIEEKGCKECKTKDYCGIKLRNTQYPILIADTDIKLNKNDKVIIKQEGIFPISSTFIIFLLPIVLMLVGYYVPKVFGYTDENIMIIFSIIFLFLSFILIKIINNFLEKKYKIKVSVIKKIE